MIEGFGGWGRWTLRGAVGLEDELGGYGLLIAGV